MNNYYSSFLSPYDITNECLEHYGILGMKWGVRRWQNADGSYNSAGKTRYGVGDGKAYQGVNHSSGDHGRVGTKTNAGNSRSSVKTQSRRSVSTRSSLKEKITDAKSITIKSLKTGKAYADTYILGKNEVDRTIKAGTKFSRIQSTAEYQDFGAYYATYKKHDINAYTGMFGTNLINRAGAAAAGKAKEAGGTFKEQLAARNKAKNSTKVYQLSLEAKKNIKVPSEANATKVLSKVMGTDKDGSFKSDLQKSIDHTAQGMKRPTQQKLFKEASQYLKRDYSTLTDSQKRTIYKALNLTLTNHESYENAIQNKFYSALRKAGYDAIDDLNDQQYSSYHAKRPTIVINTGNTAVSNTREVSKKEVENKNKIYSTERYIKEGLNVLNTLNAAASNVSLQKVYDYNSSGAKLTDELVAQNNVSFARS